MALISAGILLFRRAKGHLEFFLVHPGGPFFVNKNEGYWTIPKGLIAGEENPLETAKREFAEEIGIELKIAREDFIELGTVMQKGGKTVHGFATKLDIDASTIKSNTFELEWPLNSGKTKTFVEVDRAGWFKYDEARSLINIAQADFLERLVATM